MSDIKAAAATLAQFGAVGKVLEELGDLDEAKRGLEARVQELKGDEARIRDGIAEMRNRSVEDAQKARGERAAADAESTRRREAADAYVKQQRTSGNDELIKARAEAAKIRSDAEADANKIISDAKAEAAQHAGSVTERHRVIADLNRQIEALRKTQAEIGAKLKAAAA